MKKPFIIKLLTLILAMCSILFVATGCSGNDSSDNKNQDILNIYNIYVAYAENNGTSPLSYEEWLASIKGEKGDSGVGIDKVWIDENGHLQIKYTNSDVAIDLGKVKETKAYSQGLEYELTEDGLGYILTGVGTCNDRKVVIPSEYNNKPVVAIGGASLSYDDFIKVIEIPDSVTSIGERAFYDCSKLTRVTIGNSVTSIGKYAFYGCSLLTSIEIPNSVTSIGEEAFYFCGSLTKVNYLGSIDSWVQIEFNSYRSNPLTNGPKLYIKSIEVTEGVLTKATKINDYAFSNCKSLTSIEIPNSVTSIGYGAFYDCSSLANIEIPNSVENIGGCAFYNCDSLTSVEIPDSVTSIGKYAFSDCDSLTSVVIPNSVTSIGDYAFDSCESLTSVVIGNSVTSIGSSAFYNCESLTSVVIGNSVTSIGSSAFSICDSLTSIEIPNSVTSIGEKAFYGCIRLVEVINKSQLDIVKGRSNNGDLGYYALSVSNRDNTYISKLSVDENGFIIYTEGEDKILVGYKDTKTDIVIPNNITKINNYAFCYCDDLTSVTIGNSVTSIGERAFLGCDFLTSIEIPNSVTNIGDYAFYYCDSLTNVYYGGSVEKWNEISIGTINSNLTSATRYYYIENQSDLPNDNGNYWHYVDGVPTIWQTQE